MYYLLNKNTYEFEIKENHKIVPLEIENDSVDIEVTVDKECTTEIKPGEKVNYDLDFTTIEFAEDEYIAQTMFDFGKVDVKFKEDAKPTMECISFDTLKENDTFTNHTKTVGVYLGVTAEANSKWTTITHIPEEKHEVKLPRTGK